MRILFVGDIVGKGGRRVLREQLQCLQSSHLVDFTIVNVENSAGGFGVTPGIGRQVLDLGVDVMTSGNHIWDKREILPYLEGEMPILRPLNYPPGVPGRGYLRKMGTWVANLIGCTFIGNFESPFFVMDRLLDELQAEGQPIIVDFHAEATSEKGALAWYLDGRVSAVLGTHTHVGTIDARILPRGTAFVSDVGMTGVIDSVIGDTPESVLRRFLTGIPSPLDVGKGRVQLNAVLVDVDEGTGRAREIVRIDRETD